MTILLISIQVFLAGAFWPEVTFLTSESIPAHEYYVSVTEINYVESNHSFEISTRIFADDLERALLQHGMDSLHLGTELEQSGAGTLVAAYLGEKLALLVDGLPVKGLSLGKELSDNLAALWCYIEIKEVPDFRELTIQNKVLMEIFDDQTNMIEFRRDGQQEALFHSSIR